MSEFRRYSRKPVKYGVTIAHDHFGDFVAETQDISDSGLFVLCTELSNRLAIGDTVNANIFLEDKRSVAAGEVVVVRTTEDGIGLTYA